MLSFLMLDLTYSKVIPQSPLNTCVTQYFSAQLTNIITSLKTLTLQYSERLCELSMNYLIL